MLKREDLLELTRRMTISRSNIIRIAGAYMDPEGYDDGTFNVSFFDLSSKDKEKNLELAKAIPFAETNEAIKEYAFPGKDPKSLEMMKLLEAIRASRLENDAMLETFYGIVGENHKTDAPYSIILFFGSYDIPIKGSDHAGQWESEEVYDYLICAICDLKDEYESGEPYAGFLYPSFKDHSCDLEHIAVMNREKAEFLWVSSQR